MLNTPRGTQGIVVAPHHLAAQAGLAVLREGGNAVEAMVAAASTVAVVYPHMNSIGGDNFWLIAEPGREPVAIMACGGAGEKATAEFYRGHASIPTRGPLAANTVAGAISGWDAALAVSKRWGGRLPLSRILADAVSYGRNGAPVTASQHKNTTAKLPELKNVPGYAGQFLVNGAPPAVASLFRQPRLAATLERLARAGLDDFYRGEIAAANAADLARIGSPVTAADLRAHRALETTPLRVNLRSGVVYNVPPPTQGLASLMILGVFDRLDAPRPRASRSSMDWWSPPSRHSWYAIAWSRIRRTWRTIPPASSPTPGWRRWPGGLTRSEPSRGPRPRRAGIPCGWGSLTGRDGP